MSPSARDGTAAALLAPRYRRATATPPADPAFWRLALDECDNHAFKMARDGHGGPFAAQLWLVHPQTGRYVLVGTAAHPQDANAVLLRGAASAHAEAESLRPENRQRVSAFLAARRGEGWRVVQLSSGESCPSCRAKQIVFAQELVGKGLIEPGQFHVIFKAPYDQTAAIAGFSDAPMDRTLNAVLATGLLDAGGSVADYEKWMLQEPGLRGLMRDGEMLAPASGADHPGCAPSAEALLEQAGPRPCAVIVEAGGQNVVGSAVDERSAADAVNRVENTAILGALRDAAAQRRSRGDAEPWNLHGARLITNIHHIGPTGFAECLWYNIGALVCDRRFAGEATDAAAAECPGLDNNALFALVAGPYNADGVPIATTWLGEEDRPSAAHLYWRAHRAREALLQQQAQRLQALSAVRAAYIDGTPVSLADLAENQTESTHYDPG